MSIVRTANTEDFETVAGYEREISVISFGDQAVIDLDFHIRKLENSFKKERDGMLVLEDFGEIRGWLWMALKSNSLTGERYVNFKSFYLEEGYRNAECSNRLLGAGMSFCEKSGAKSVTGKVHAKNLAMRVLYKNFGFEPTHITMERRL